MFDIYVMARPGNVDGMIVWIFTSFTLIVAFPLIIKYTMYFLVFATHLIGTAIYRILRLFKKSEYSKKTIDKNVVYNIKKKPRVFKMRDEKGVIRHPLDDEVVQMYFERNTNYPDIDSPSYENAINLNMDYFLSSDYPYDYIVLGDRAQIEEARKGSRLTDREEGLIFLGYGYDGRPFGEPWGIEEECLNDFIYAKEQGDLLEWFDTPDTVEYKYKAYLGAGYQPPMDYYFGINHNVVDDALDMLADYGEAVPSLDKKIFNQFKEHSVKETNQVLSFK